MYSLKDSMNHFSDYHSGDINIHVSSFNYKIKADIQSSANKECWFPHYRYEKAICTETIGIFIMLIIWHVE